MRRRGLGMPLVRRTVIMFGALLVAWCTALVAGYLFRWTAVSAITYYAIVWFVIGGALLAGSYFVVGGSRVDSRRRWVAALLATLASVGLILATAALLTNVLAGELWAFTLAASVGWVVLIAAEGAAVAMAIARIVARERSV